MVQQSQQDQQSRPAGQSQQDHDPRKDGDIKVQMSVPVAQAGDAMGFLGLGGGQEEAPNQSVEAQPEPGIAEMLAESHPEDVEALKQKMAEAGNPMPEGVNMPAIASEMPRRYGDQSPGVRSTRPAGTASGAGQPARAGQPAGRPSVPAGQEGIPQFTGGGGGLPSQREAFEYSMKEPPKVQTKQEFEAGQKAPSWWRMMLADFAGGAPGAGKEELDKRMDKAYQEAVQRQMQDRSEFERKQGLVGQYAVSRGDELVKFIFGEREIEIERKNTGQLAGMFLEEYKAATQKDKNVSLRTLLPGDPNAPDWHLPEDKAIEYANYFTNQKNAGLGTGRDLLRVKNPELWQFLEDHEQAQAKELIEARQNASDKVKQIQMTEIDQMRERSAMEIEGEYGIELSPGFSSYLDQMTIGRTGSYVNPTTKETVKTEGREAISDDEKAALKENLMMINHTQYKGEGGGESPYRDYWQRTLEKDGWHFMGERIPDDKKKAAAKLRTMRDRGISDTVQTSAFMMAHFGTWNKDFGVDPANFMFLQPNDGEMVLGSGSGRYYYPPPEDPQEQRKRLDKESPLKSGQIGEAGILEFMEANEVTWEQALAVFKELGKEVVMGR